MLAHAAELLVGMGLLCLGAHWLILGAMQLSERLGIPKAVAGLTLVALGTSAPELVVNILAALDSRTEFALSNVSGSNLANVCLGLGLCGILGGIGIRRHDFGSDAVMTVVTMLLVLAALHWTVDNALPVWAILPLTGLMIYFCRSLMGRPNSELLVEPGSHSLWAGCGWFGAGMLGLYWGGSLVLDSAIIVAHRLQIRDEIMALTVVALGTSVPDITATVMAALRKEFALAVGNILGSNISNVVVVLNGTLMACLHPLQSSVQVRMDYLAVVAICTALCFLVFAHERIGVAAGWGLLATYLGYLSFRLATLPVVA